MTPLPTRVVHASTAHGSADNRIRHKECAALAANGYTVTYLCRSQPDSPTSSSTTPRPRSQTDTVTTVALPARTSRMSRALLGSIDIWRQLTRIEPEILHVHDPELIPLAALWRTTKKKVAIYDAHEDLALQITGKTYIPRPLMGITRLFGRSLEIMASLTLNAVVVANPHHQRHFPPAKTQLVQNFPWRSDFGGPATSVQPRATTTDFVYIGAVSVNRGSLAMADGASRQGASLLVAGAIGDAESSRALVRPGITTLGPVNASRIPEILRSSRAGLALLKPLPNYLEAQSTKIYEYMAAGIPFIASAFPNWKSQLDQYKAGIFVDPLDEGEISEAMRWIVENPQSAREMGRRGREASTRWFTFEGQAEGLLSLYSRLTVPYDRRRGVDHHD